MTCKGAHIVEVTLIGNNLQGSLGDGLAKLTNVHMLNLGNNHMAGTIPEAFAGMTGMTYIDLWCNRLVGVVPALPFQQYTEGCFIGGPQGPDCHSPYQPNGFSCPLPAESGQCNDISCK